MKIVKALAAHLFIDFQTQNRFNGLIFISNNTFPVNNRDDIRRLIRKCPEQLLLMVQFFLDELAFGDVYKTA